MDKIGEFPVVGSNFAKLTVTNRQLPDKTTKKVRSDVRLAHWFTEESEERDEDIFAEIQDGVPDGKIVFKQWHDKEELENLLLETIKEVTGMESIDDVDGFSRSMGGIPHADGKYKGLTFFNYTKGDSEGCACHAEDWQILAPVRNHAHGVIHMNHLIHEKYRKESLELADNTMSKSVLAELYYKYAASCDERNETKTAVLYYKKCIYFKLLSHLHFLFFLLFYLLPFLFHPHQLILHLY